MVDLEDYYENYLRARHTSAPEKLLDISLGGFQLDVETLKHCMYDVLLF